MPGVVWASARCVPPIRRLPAPGSVGQSRGSVIIRGDCGLSALVIVVNLSSYPEIYLFALFFTFI